MTVRLLYFAWVREHIGLADETVEISSPQPAGELLKSLCLRSDGHAAALHDAARLRLALNQTHRGWDAMVNPGDEVAIFPPVTGG